MTYKKINITTIWGGKGSYSMLSSLKWNKDYNLSSIVSMSDSWGSAWRLMREFDTPIVGDVRRGIMALSSEHEYFKQLFDYRFSADSSLAGHNMGNLIMTAMSDITWDFEKWLKQTAKMFKVKWRVLPVTFDRHDLCVDLENGQKICGEAHIDEPKHDPNLKIVNTYLNPQPSANPKAIKAIEKSDLIILNFGDLYTSLLPNLLVDGIAKAIEKNKDAKVVYFCNLMTKSWETHDFEVIDFIDTVEKYLWEGVIDYVVVNDWYISDEMSDKYKKLENKKPIKLKFPETVKWKQYTVLERDLLHENAFIRHSFEKIWKVVEEILWICSL